MIDNLRLAWCVGPCLALACGDSGGRESASVSASGTTVVTTTPTASGPGTESAGSSASSQGTGSASETGGMVSSTEPATGTASTGGVKFDLGVVPDGGDKCQGSQLDFSYIWVANSSQGTVSKINTVTMVEEGRYLVRPDGAGNPSRTSVNLSGDVVIANRFGGITKVYARPESCPDTNGVPGIQTSAGKDDILAWGADECVAWYTAMPYDAQRPMAWTSGVFNKDMCRYEEQKVWTTGGNTGVPGSVVALRLNGDDGAIEQTIPIPEMGTPGAGPYGGAVDGDNNFWFHSRDINPFLLARLDAVTLTYKVYPVPAPVAPYGITVDTKNRVWLAGYTGGTARFDPVTETWQTNLQVTGLGLQEDAKGRMWIAHYPWDVRGIHGLDVETMTELKFINMTAVATESRGISVDFKGFVWMVDQTASAFRVDADAETWDIYTGLTGPYTYSDMTGWGLSNISPG